MKSTKNVQYCNWLFLFQNSVVIKEIVENGTSTEAHVLSDADLHSLDPLGECLHSDILGKSFNSILLTFLSNFEKAS